MFFFKKNVHQRVEDSTVNILIDNQVLILFSALCAFLFLYSWSKVLILLYIYYYLSWVIKQICKMCDYNISNNKYEKLRSYLSQGSCI